FRRNRRTCRNTRYLGRRERVVVSNVDEDVESSDDQCAAYECEREVAPGIAHLASDGRYVVPSIVSPQRSEHSRDETCDAAASARQHSIARAANIGERKM